MKVKAIFFICLTFCLLYFTKSNALTPQQNKNFDSIANATVDICNFHYTIAQNMLQDLYKTANANPTDLLLLSKCVYVESFMNITHGIKDSALISRIHSLLTSLKDKEFQKGENILKYALALNYVNTEDYAKSFTLGLEVLEDFKKEKDTAFIIKTLNMMGIICSNINSLKMSRDYFEEAIQYTPHGTKEYYNIRLNIFGTWRGEQKMQKNAIDTLLKLIPIFIENKDSTLLLRAYTSLAFSYLNAREQDKAFEYYNIILKDSANIDNKLFINILKLNIGAYFYYQNNYKEAFKYLNEAKTMAVQNKYLKLYACALEALAYIYPKLGHIDSAYYCLLEYQQLSNQLFNNPKTIEAYREYVSAYLETSKDKLTIAEQGISLKNKQLLIVIISAIGIIIVISLLLVIARQKRKQKDAENIELTKNIEQEKVIQQLKEEKNKLELESKTREIASYSFQLANKNQLLQQISGSVNALPVQKETSAIKHLVKNSLNSENEWNDFLMQFNKVHPAFFDKLKQICSDFTETNLRMFAYFRIGMSTKQIAQIMNVSPRSVIMHRHRLKKKLGLEDDDNIDDFIRNL